MRGLIWFLVVAALAVGLGLLARMNEGYVLLVVPPYRIELSLALTIITVVASFALVYSVLRLVVHTLRLPSYVAGFRRRQRHNRGQTAMRNAWQAYLEGRFGRAHRYAARAYELGEATPLATLIAARAAHFMRDPERRDAWLERAEREGADSRHARLVTRAELLLDERRYEEAREVLRELVTGGTRHVSALRLLLRAEQGLHNWEEVLDLVRELEKRGAISAESARQLTVTATVENLRKKALDADGVRHFWREVDEDERFDPRVALAASRLFQRLGDDRTAHAILRDAIERHWDEELVRAYGEGDAADSIERLERAERWLASRPRDAALLLTLGRLCLARELWGKAESYLEASLAEAPSKGAHIELARLYERLGRHADANGHYRSATDPQLPA